MKRMNKRDMLVQAAADRFYRFGISASSIADVATAAGIPAGNVYYYFRTKDALVSAVHDYWQRRTADALAELDARDGDARARISEFLDRSERNATAYAKSGCPFAALSRDCRSGGAELQPLAGRIFERQVAWLRAQFARMGLTPGEQMREAWAVLTAIQGGIGMAHATDSPAPLLSAIADARLRVSSLAAA